MKVLHPLFEPTIVGIDILNMIDTISCMLFSTHINSLKGIPKLFSKCSVGCFFVTAQKCIFIDERVFLSLHRSVSLSMRGTMTSARVSLLLVSNIESEVFPSLSLMITFLGFKKVCLIKFYYTI